GGHHISPFNLTPLADVEVLAVRTEPVTARRGNREYLRTRHVVRYRLLLYRIDVPSNHLPIDQEMQFATNILSHTAKSNLPLGNLTVASARFAYYLRVRQ